MKRITIGRDPNCDIHIESQWDTVSNRHGELVYDGETLSYIDHSTNGTVINDQKIQNTTVGIYPGDNIRLANAYELGWDTIERHFPDLRNRPTVTRNVRGEAADTGRRTMQFNVGETKKGRQTERFNSAEPAAKDDKDTSADNNANFGQANEYSQSEIDRAIESWNWGAFFGSWFWGVFNGVYWPLFILLIIGIPYLGQVCSLCLCVYLGVNGSKMAWRSGRFSSFHSFKKAQRVWAIIGIFLFAAYVVGHIYLLNITLNLL